MMISKAFITRDAADIGAAAAAHAAANGFARKQAAFVTKRAVPAVLAHLSGKRRVYPPSMMTRWVVEVWRQVTCDFPSEGDDWLAQLLGVAAIIECAVNLCYCYLGARPPT